MQEVISTAPAASREPARAKVDALTRSAWMRDELSCWNIAPFFLGGIHSEGVSVSAVTGWVAPCQSVTGVPAAPGTVRSGWAERDVPS